MKLYTIKQYLFAGLILAFAACKPEIDPQIAVTKGSADFSRYIAVGNSLTAGYADGGLYLEGQKNSYPAIIAEQMKAAGGGEFLQPLFTEAQSDGSGYLKISSFNADGTPKIDPVSAKTAIRGTATIPGFGNVILYTKYAGDINNYGIPGIKLQQITFAPYGNVNGFFERFLPGNAGTNNTTYLDFVTAKPFTFFTNWLGNNDALGYATTGGTDPLTPKDQFSGLYNLLITRLTASGAKGAVATIPDVSSIPFLNTVTINALLAGARAASPTTQFPGIFIQSPSAPGGVRIATSEDLVSLSFQSTGLFGKPTPAVGTTPANSFPYGLHPNNPIENKYILDKAEVATAQDFVNAYNTTIKSIAIAKGLAIFDAFTFLNTLRGRGIVVDGVTVNASFVSGNAFSLDGVHLTPLGYAITANEFIKVINAKYGSTIPEVATAKYSGVRFP